MRLSRTNMPLASSDAVISQPTYAVFLDNLAPHLRTENPDHKLFCHSQPQNPPQLSKSGLKEGWSPRLHQSPFPSSRTASNGETGGCLIRRTAVVRTRMPGVWEGWHREMSP